MPPSPSSRRDPVSQAEGPNIIYELRILPRRLCREGSFCLGTLNLRVPKLRQGSYFPGFLTARKTSEQALVAVIQEAWIGGVSARRIDELVQAMGLRLGAGWTIR